MVEDAQMKIRLPRPLKERIEAAALAGKRKMNAEIVERLERSFTEENESWLEKAQKSPNRQLETYIMKVQLDLESQIDALKESVAALEQRLKEHGLG